MSPALTRRRALATADLAEIGMGVPAFAVVAQAAPAGITCPEAAALRAGLARLSGEYRAACREVDETGERVSYPDPPEALYVRPGDQRLFMRQSSASWSDAAEGRDWWADHDTVERLRGDTFRYLNGRPDEQAVARRDEIVLAFDRWRASDRSAEDAAGYTAAQARFDAASEAFRTFRTRLVNLRTEDIEVLAVKALAIVDLCDRDAVRLDRLMKQAMEEAGGASETALALSMARDFIGMFAANAWGTA